MKTSTYFTKEDVALHCTTEDLWVSKFGKVYDYTNLVRVSPSNQVEALIRCAGQDITDWFDKKTKDFPVITDPVMTRPRLPFGLQMLDVDLEKCANFDITKETEGDQNKLFYLTNPDLPPWWQDENYQIGLLGTSRPLEILNTLTLHRHKLNVCEEETLADIAARYARFNSAAEIGYRWRFDEKDLDMNKNLTENGIPDERATYKKLGWPVEQWYVPCITLVWKDQMI